MAFHVPSGAGGHLAAGILALEMGLPNCRLVAATNKNGALHDFFQTRILKRKSETRTVSPSMDICVPYNVWRMLYTVCPQSVGLMYKSFEETGNLCVRAVRSLFSFTYSDNTTRIFDLQYSNTNRYLKRS